MGSDFTENLNLEKPATGEQIDQWGNTLNANFDKIDAEAGVKFEDMPSFEALAPGDIISIFEDGGVTKARQADATTAGKEADGYVLAASIVGAPARVLFTGVNNQLTGRTPGAKQFLSTTKGQLTETPPNASNNIVQEIGRGILATSATFAPKLSIQGA